MDTIIHQFGVDYLRWTREDGCVFEAVKEQVEFFGKEVFEQEFEEICDELDTDADGITFSPTHYLNMFHLTKSSNVRFNF